MRRLLWIAVFVSLPSCHSSDGLARVEVQGKVTYEGAPVKRGMIVFRPANKSKGPAAGAAVVDGKFLLTRDKGPTPGPHEVELKIVDSSAELATMKEPAQIMHRASPLKSFSQQVEIKNSGVNEFEFSFAATPPTTVKSSAK